MFLPKTGYNYIIINFNKEIIIMSNPASEKQMALIKKHNMPVHSDTLTVKEASAFLEASSKAYQ